MAIIGNESKGSFVYQEDAAIKQKVIEEMQERWYASNVPNNLSVGGTQPLLPIFVTEVLGGTVAHVGLVTASASIASVPSSIIWGNLSDKLKMRKAFIILGFLGMGIALLCMGLSGTIGHFLAANILMGIVGSASIPIAVVLILETSEERHWPDKISKFSKMGGWGSVFGMAIGGMWFFVMADNGSGSGARMLFFTFSAISFISAIMAFIWIDETHRKKRIVARKNVLHINLRTHERAHYMPQRLLHIPTRDTIKKMKMHGFNINHRFFRFLCVIFIVMSAFVMFYTIFPVYLVREISFHPAEVFLVYIAQAIAAALTYDLVGRVVHTRGSAMSLSLAVGGRAVVIPIFLSVWLFREMHILVLAAVFILQFLMGMCWAVYTVSGHLVAAEISPVQAKGESLGLYNAVTGTATISGALLGGIVAYTFGYCVAVIVPSLMLASAFTAICIIHKVHNA